MIALRATFLSVSLAGSAAAAPFCESLQALETQESTDITYQDSSATCKPSMSISGAINMHCYWVFPYRAEAATQTFQNMVADVAACLGPNATVMQDQSVNHPDAYDLREFKFDARDIGVSIKDKGALQQTLVFVRVLRR